MKCPKCNGTGWDVIHGFDCISCDGKGEIELTNEEWFCQLSTEEKADVLNEFVMVAYYAGLDEKLPPKHNCKHFMKWLKEKHE